MQAVILAAGQSSRFYPYNKRHKSLIPLLGEPIVAHTIRSIKRSGITDVILVVGAGNDFEKVLGNGRKYGVKIRYVIQESPTGMGDAILAASKLIKDDFFVAHASRVEFQELKEDIDKKRVTNNFAIILCEKSSSLAAYGVIKAAGDNVVEIVEKPEKGKEPSNMRIKGFYFLNKEFVEVLKKVKKHQYNFEEALDSFAKSGKVKYALTERITVTLKYPWDLFGLKDYLFAKKPRSISKKASVSSKAVIEGNVVVEEGAVISENAIIKGPAYIGKNAYVGTNSLLRNGVVLGESSVIGANAEVKNTIFLTSSKMHSGLIEDSIIGRDVRIGAEITTANTRIDRDSVKVAVGEKKIDSEMRNLGTIIGDGTMLGAKVVIMPGVIIGCNVNIGPSTTVMKNIEEDTIFYTKFAEHIEKKKPARS